MEKIYIITSGCYSDYRIVTAFSTKKKADEFLDICDDDYRLEIYTIDSVEPVRKNKIWRISLDVQSKKVIVCSQYELKRNKHKKDLLEYTRYHDNSYGIDFYLESDSRKRAIKIASERFGYVIANELITFPFLRQQIIDLRYSNGYPSYDFNTGEIVLSQYEDFKDENNLPKGLRFRKLLKEE